MEVSEILQTDDHQEVNADMQVIAEASEYLTDSHGEAPDSHSVLEELRTSDPECASNVLIQPTNSEPEADTDNSVLECGGSQGVVVQAETRESSSVLPDMPIAQEFAESRTEIDNLSLTTLQMDTDCRVELENPAVRDTPSEDESVFEVKMTPVRLSADAATPAWSPDEAHLGSCEAWRGRQRAKMIASIRRDIEWHIPTVGPTSIEELLRIERITDLTDQLEDLRQAIGLSKCLSIDSAGIVRIDIL